MLRVFIIKEFQDHKYPQKRRLYDQSGKNSQELAEFSTFQGLASLARERPRDPIEYLAGYLIRKELASNIVCRSYNKQLIETNIIVSFYEIHGYYYEATLSATVVIALQLIKPLSFHFIVR